MFRASPLFHSSPQFSRKEIADGMKGGAEDFKNPRNPEESTEKEVDYAKGKKSGRLQIKPLSAGNICSGGGILNVPFHPRFFYVVGVELTHLFTLASELYFRFFSSLQGELIKLSWTLKGR